MFVLKVCSLTLCWYCAGSTSGQSSAFIKIHTSYSLYSV